MAVFHRADELHQNFLQVTADRSRTETSLEQSKRLARERIGMDSESLRGVNMISVVLRLIM